MRNIEQCGHAPSKMEKSARNNARHRSRFRHLACLLAACITGPVLLGGCAEQAYPVANVSQANARVAEGYRIAVGDKLRITVFNEQSLSGEFDVGLDGKLEMPLISPVSAAGQTPDGVRQAITAKLGEGGFVLEPRVAVAVLSYHPFYVLGEVNKPGEYSYASDLSLLQAIAMAGGFTARANKASVVVRRNGWDSGRKVPLEDPLLIIAPGDTVTVTESVF